MRALIDPWRERNQRSRDSAARRLCVLVDLLERDGPMDVRQLGAKTSIDQTTINADLALLELDGVVKRERVRRPGPKQPAFLWSIK